MSEQDQASEDAALLDRMEPANELRGEVDIEFEGERFVLRPSFAAILNVEKLTGKGLLQLATEATDAALSLTEAATICTHFIKAWGKSIGRPQVEAINAERIAELIYDYGLMRVCLRLAYVLGLAATGGCRPDGTLKQGEAEAAGETTETPAAASPE